MSNDGLIFGYILNGPNKGEAIDWENLPDQLPKSHGIWLHLDYSSTSIKNWLREHPELESIVSGALLEEETRPRASIVQNGVLISLRGINLSEGSEPEDMVSVRLWSDGKNIISTRRRQLVSAREIAKTIETKQGPETPAQIIVLMTELLIDRMQDTIQEIEDRVDAIEEVILEENSYSLRSEIANLRRRAISLRRYLAPQREAMSQLQSEKIKWFSADDRNHLREINDCLTRYIEDLDSARERAAVTQEELVNRLGEQMNNRMYILSIVAAIFLPLGFLTGLLGINVAGIPGSDNPNAFILFVIFLLVIIALQLWIFKRKKWF